MRQFLHQAVLQQQSNPLPHSYNDDYNLPRYKENVADYVLSM